MQEYTRAFLNPFPWAKVAYDYALGLSLNEQVQTTAEELAAPVYNKLPGEEIQIQGHTDWNLHTRRFSSLLASLYKVTDQSFDYSVNLYTRLNARLSETEARIRKNEQDLRGFKSTLGLASTNSITVQGGDLLSVDLNPIYYQDLGTLQPSVEEGVFRLPDTGSFSSLRSLGGFAGSAVIERQLGHIVQNGSLDALSDGSRATFWMGTHYSPAPLRANTGDITWLPEEYQHGFAFMITYYMDRPTLASEVYLHPASTEPFQLISVSYTPWGAPNILQAGTFEVSGSWIYNTGTTRVSGQGVDASWAAVCQAPSGYISQTFDLVSALNRTISGVHIAATSGEVLDTRVEIVYNMKGRGDCVAGVRLVWLDSAGDIITYKADQNFPTGFYRNLRMVDYAPPQAVSGRIDLGIFTPTTLASAFFDSVEVYVGEQRKSVNQRIDKPTTVLIRNREGAVLSQRFSFVFAQTNPRRENLSKEAAEDIQSGIQRVLDVDPVAQQSISLMQNQLLYRGSGEQIWAYRVGLKDLDVRYREFIPRGTLVTHPLKTRREIRRIWMSAEISRSDNEGTNFYVYPFSSDTSTRISIQPYLLGELSDTQYSTGLGQIYYVFTTEEVASGWANTNLDNTLIVDPKPVREVFDGTDRTGKVRLNEAPHLRRPEMVTISKWLDSLSARTALFDPNAETTYGITNSTIRNLLKSGMVSGLSIPASSVTSRSGYIPLRVTVKTDKWTSHQDTFGRPESSLVQFVEREELEQTEIYDSITNTRDDTQSFDSWLNSTTGGQFWQTSPQYLWIKTAAGPQLTDSHTLRQYLDAARKQNTEQGYFSMSEATLRQALRLEYDILRSRGQVPAETGQVRTETASLQRAGAYKTRYRNIVSGPTGTFMQLFWHNPDTGEYLAVPRNVFKVQPETGLVVLQKDAPSEGFTSVLGSYWYIPDTSIEDYSSQTLSYLTDTSSSMVMANSYTGMKARNYPVCRNMTDYQNGRVPELKPPDFDPLSRTYYPVIEYYITGDNEIQFARDFFRYGDLPATIEVEYLTLGLSPRAALEMDRGGSPTSSSSVASFNLFVRESAASPLREVE